MTPRLVELVREAQQLIGAHNDDATEAVRACNVNKAWHLLDRLASRLMAEGGLVGAATPAASLEEVKHWSALEVAVEAVETWLCTFAADMVAAEDAVDARARIEDAGGTLSYIAKVQPILLQARLAERLLKSTPVDDGAVERAAKALLADVRRRYPGEALRCPHMIALAAALEAAEPHP